MSRFAHAAEIVQNGVDAHAFPAAVIEAGTSDSVAWRQAFGRLDGDPQSPATQRETMFDLASLTKVIATSSLVMRLIGRGALALNDPIRRWIPEWRGTDRE